MKRILTTLSVAMLAGAAHAQSSVTLYGLLDVGLVYASNEHGSANYKMLSGTTQNDRWGLKVNEDLGGGLAAVATLENGFDLTSGKFQQGGREFGRQAYVGLSDKQYGTFLMGRQYDAMSDFLIPFSPTSSASSLAFHIGDNDNLNGGFRYSNSVKYVTPNVNGLRVEALYAFSNSPGAFGTNRAVSAGATYANGAFAAAVTYLNIDQPGTLNTNGAVSDDYAGAPFQLFHTSPLNAAVGVSRQRVLGGAASYKLGNATVYGLVTDVRYSYRDGTGLHLTNYDVNMNYQMSASIVLAGGYYYTIGNYSGISQAPHWNTVHASIDYALSKRTDASIFAVYMKSKGGPADIWLQVPSNSGNQTVLAANIRHKF